MRIVKCRRVAGEFKLSKTTINEARKLYSTGNLLVYPTDTVYGLGGDPFQENVVRRIFDSKRRHKEMPMSMAVPSHEALWFYGFLNNATHEFCLKYLPGPVTILLIATSLAPKHIVSPDGLIGLRIPDHPIASQLLRSLGPLTATSANHHGQPPPVTCKEAIEQLGDDVSLYLDAGPCKHGRESTVVDLSGETRKIIRQGVLSEEDMRNA